MQHGPDGLRTGACASEALAAIAHRHQSPHYVRQHLVVDCRAPDASEGDKGGRCSGQALRWPNEEGHTLYAIRAVMSAGTTQRWPRAVFRARHMRGAHSPQVSRITACGVGTCIGTCIGKRNGEERARPACKRDGSLVGRTPVPALRPAAAPRPRCQKPRRRRGTSGRMSTGCQQSSGIRGWYPTRPRCRLGTMASRASS
jgi:hypothetical protein